MIITRIQRLSMFESYFQSSKEFSFEEAYQENVYFLVSWKI